MKQPVHTITLVPWRGASFGERMALEAITAVMWPLTSDERMTVLMTLLGGQITDTVEHEDQIEAIIEMLRMHLMARAGR